MEKLIECFNDLSLNDKRKEVNNELMRSYIIVKDYLATIGKTDIPEPYNYVSSVGSKLSEEEMLALIYKDLIMLKNNILLLISSK